MTQELYSTQTRVESVSDFRTSIRNIRKGLNAGCKHFEIDLELNKICDAIKCADFISDVMRITYGKATVCWRQSAHKYVRRVSPGLADKDINKVFDVWPNSIPQYRHC